MAFLHQLMLIVLRGGDTNVIRRSEVARKLFAKVQKMKNRVAQLKRLRHGS